MKRTEKHRDVKRIVRAVDRAIASHCDSRDGLVSNVATSILHFGRYAGDDFVHWSNEGVRALLLVHALHATNDELKAMATVAEREFKWVEWWEREGWIECRVGERREHLVEMQAQLIKAGVEPTRAFAAVQRVMSSSKANAQAKPAEAAVH